MEQNDFLQRIIELSEQLVVISQQQATTSDELLAMIKRHDEKLDNHAEQINRLTRMADRLIAFIERNGRRS